MALGDNNNNGNKNGGIYENSYYSRTNSRNYTNNTSLDFSYWKGMLKISIQNVFSSGQSTKFDEVAFVHLTPVKARAMLSCIRALKNEDYASTKSFGVDTGMTDVKKVLAVSNKEFNNEMHRVLYISKVDADGNVLESAEYFFTADNYYTISWDNFDSMKYNKQPINDAELDNLYCILKQFVEASTGATAYSVMDMNRYNYASMSNRINDIMDKMGIQRRTKSNNNSGGYSSNSYFNNSSNKSTTNENMSINDLDDMMDI